MSKRTQLLNSEYCETHSAGLLMMTSCENVFDVKWKSLTGVIVPRLSLSSQCDKPFLLFIEKKPATFCGLMAVQLH